MEEKPIRLCFNRNTFKQVDIPEEDRFLNTLILGPTGTGKSSLILTPLIYQDLVNTNCGVTIIDPKEDLAEKIYELAKELNNRKIVYIDPLDEFCPKINPFQGETEKVIKNLIKIFAPTFTISSVAEKQSVDLNRNLLIKSLRLLKTYPSLCGDNINIKTFSDFISNKHNEARMKIIKLHEVLKKSKENLEFTDICEWFLFQYLEPSTGLFDKCDYLRMKVDDLATNEYLSRILTPENGEQNIVNFDEHLAQGDIVIINTKNTVLGHLGKTFGEFLMLSFLNSVFRRKHYNKMKKIADLKPHFLYIDEFPTFSPVLTEMFTQGRSFKVGTHIAVQNRTLLKICGDEDTRNQAFMIESNARNVILFPGLNGEDAEYYSKQFFNLTPSQIMYRPFGQIIYRIVQNRTIQPPDIGLVFFIDEIPHTDSLKNEFNFDSNEQVIYVE